MAMTFTPVQRQGADSYEFDEEFIKDFMAAWEYLSVNTTHYLKHEFKTSQEREEWLEKAKAFGKTKPSGEEVVVRRVKRTGSSDPNTGHLSFVMEAKSVADARHARLRKQAEDRDRRRQNGEELTPGRPRRITRE